MQFCSVGHRMLVVKIYRYLKIILIVGVYGNFIFVAISLSLSLRWVIVVDNWDIIITLLHKYSFIAVPAVGRDWCKQL
jgi:hypothetical protein